MERKISICHVCGAEVKRFADHMAGVHKRLDYKKEKVSSVHIILDDRHMFSGV